MNVMQLYTGKSNYPAPKEGSGRHPPRILPLADKPSGKTDWGAKLGEKTRNMLIGMGGRLKQAVVAEDKAKVRIELDRIAKFLTEEVAGKNPEIVARELKMGGFVLLVAEMACGTEEARVFVPFKMKLTVSHKKGQEDVGVTYVGTSSNAEQRRDSVDGALVEIAGKASCWGRK